jgi:hypothetical protein
MSVEIRPIMWCCRPWTCLNVGTHDSICGKKPFEIVSEYFNIYFILHVYVNSSVGTIVATHKNVWSLLKSACVLNVYICIIFVGLNSRYFWMGYMYPLCFNVLASCETSAIFKKRAVAQYTRETEVELWSWTAVVDCNNRANRPFKFFI